MRWASERATDTAETLIHRLSINVSAVSTTRAERHFATDADLGHNGVVKTVQAPPAEVAVEVDARTRDRVARLLMELGPVTAAASS